MGQHPHDLDRGGLHVLIAWLAAGALGAPAVTIEATVAEDRRSIAGTVRAEAGISWADPLAALPEPAADLVLLRTYPGRRSRGEVTWTVMGDGSWAFEARIPRRFDATGSTRAGLFANGGWYPQPSVLGDPLPEIRWDVTITLPDGDAGALGDVAGSGTLRWTGVADRAPLAVVRGGRVTRLEGPAYAVDLVERGRHRKRLAEEVEHVAGAVATEVTVDVAVVESPLRRRLARPGPGLLFLSDRAFRLTPGLERIHRRAVAAGMLAAASGAADPFARDVAGAVLVGQVAPRLAAIDASATLRKIRWLPSVDALLSSRRMPFYADILGDAEPGDPLRDDLAEVWAPAVPGSLVAVQLADRFGARSATLAARGLAAGLPDDAVEQIAGLPAGWLAQWRIPAPPQDYRLTVDGGEILVDRVVEGPAPEETVRVVVDGVPLFRTGGPGEFRIVLPATPETVLLDPGRRVPQLSRAGDAWPPRYNATFAAAIDSINLTRTRVTGSAWSTLRRSGDTHNVFSGALSTSDVNLVSARVGYTRREGALLDGFNRPHRFSAAVGASYLDPSFSTDGGTVALDGSLGWSTDTRVSWEFPLAGHRLWASVGGGFLPATPERWTSAGTGASAVAGIVPRVAVAGRLSGSVAQSPVAHRLLALGGSSGMLSIPELPACDAETPPPCQALATARGLGAVELRWAIIRGASVPGILAWGSELQLAVGAEGVVAEADGLALATGVTAGVTGIYELFGAEPTMFGLTAGWPVAWSGLALEPTAVPEILLRWSQAF